MKKVGKTTRPFSFNLNQIPYDYIVEVTNRFKGLNLIGRVPKDLWMEVPESGDGDQDHPQGEKMQKGKTVV